MLMVRVFSLIIKNKGRVFLLIKHNTNETTTADSQARHEGSRFVHLSLLCFFVHFAHSSLLSENEQSTKRRKRK